MGVSQNKGILIHTAVKTETLAQNKILGIWQSTKELTELISSSICA
jgi:hypothetical protein